MSPLLKGILLALAGIVTLFAVAIAVVVITFDPNDYKDDIQVQVKQHTGRDLLLSGPLELTVFPWLGVKVEQLSLSNATGFADPVFASLNRLDVRLQLLPLLKGKVQIGLISLDGLTLNLERKAEGSANWDDLGAQDAAAETPAEPAEEGSGFSLSELRVAGLQITNARVQWRDAGALTVVDGLNLETGTIAENEESNLILAVQLMLADKTSIDLKLETGWLFSLEGPSASATQLKVQVHASGAQVPGGEQTVDLVADAKYDGKAQRAEVSNGNFGMAGQRVEFSAVLRDLAATMLVDAQLKTRGFEVAKVAKALQVELPPQSSNWPVLNLELKTRAELAEGRVPATDITADFGALKLKADGIISSLDNLAGRGGIHIAPLDLHGFLASLGYPLALEKSAGQSQLDFNWTLAKDRIAVEGLKGLLAGEALGGSLSVQNFSAPVLRANLDLAGMTVADWAGKSEEPKTKPKEEKSGDINAMEVPLDWAKDLNLTARVAISRFNAYGVKLRDVLWTADARPGQPVRQKLSANAYGGEVALNNSIDASKPDPLLGLDISAKAIGLGDFLKDGWGSRWISGTTELGMNLTGKGKTVGALRSNANGDASYRLKDGEMQGFSLVDVVRKASALTGGGQQAAAGSNATTFSELFGRAVMESGKVRLQDIGGGDNSWFKFGGKGIVDLVAGAYDLTLAPVLLKNDQTSADKTLSKLIGIGIPISVTGPLTAPKFKVDLDSLLKEQAKAKIDSKVDEKKDELRNKLNEKLGDFLRPR